MVPAARARPITAPNRPRPRQNFPPPLPPPPSPPSPPLPASASASASTLAATRPSSPLSPSPPLPLLPRERPCAPAWPHCTGCLCHLSKASARPLWPPRTGPLPPSLLSSLPLFKPKPARESARPRIGRDWCGPSLAMFYRKTVDLREPVFLSWSSGRGQAFRWQGIIAAVPSPGPKPPIFGREKLGSSGLHRCGGVLDAPLGLVSPAPSEYVRSLGKMDPMRTPDPDLRN